MEMSCSDFSSAVVIPFLGGWKFEIRSPIQQINRHFTYNAMASTGEDGNHSPQNILNHDVWTRFWLFWTKKNRKPPSPRLWRTAVRKDSLWLRHSSKAASEGVVSRHNTTAHALKVLMHYLGTLLGTYIPADGNESRNVMCQQLPAAENISFHLIFFSTWGAGGGRHSPAAKDSLFWGRSTENCTNLALL